MADIVENFFTARPEGEDAPERVQAPKRFVVAAFVPATDRLLLKRLPAPKEGLIVRPQIAEEQSEYGEVIAIGRDVDVPWGVVAKFSKYSGAEEIHFEDENEGDEYVLVYKHDIRGWFGEPLVVTVYYSDSTLSEPDADLVEAFNSGDPVVTDSDASD